MHKDFWRKSRVGVIGGGAFGSVLARMAARHCAEVRVWVRSEEQVREISTNRDSNEPWIKVVHDHQEFFSVPMEAILWALPSAACREQAKAVSKFFRGDEILIHATKGIEECSMKRISTVLREEIPCPRIGVLSGPNLASELEKDEPAGTVIASRFQEVIDAAQSLFISPVFRVYSTGDVVGVEWAGTLKNIYAIASGVLNALGFGKNTHALLISRALAEMVVFGRFMGAEERTFLGMAGVGDLVATCSSNHSRNFKVGEALARGQKLSDVLANLGAVAEGVKTARSVSDFARERKLEMPIAFGVDSLLKGEVSAAQMLQELMARPTDKDWLRE